MDRSGFPFQERSFFGSLDTRMARAQCSFISRLLFSTCSCCVIAIWSVNGTFHRVFVKRIPSRCCQDGTATFIGLFHVQGGTQRMKGNKYRQGSENCKSWHPANWMKSNDKTWNKGVQQHKWNKVRRERKRWSMAFYFDTPWKSLKLSRIPRSNNRIALVIQKGVWKVK